MRRLLPRSLLAQMILLIGAALLVAQAANLAFILSEQQKLNLAQNEGPAITRFAEAARQLVASGRNGSGQSGTAAQHLGFSLAPASVVEQLALQRRPELERRLSDALAEAQVPVSEVRAASWIGSGNPHPGPDPDRAHGPHEIKLAFLSARLPGGAWLNARIEVERPNFWLVHRMILATFLLYVIVLGAAAWVAVRLARPIRDLAKAAEGFEGREPVAPVTPRGPSDVRRAIHAFNAMNQRFSAMLDEKDHMLGAIGHDLRTPLASIRIRAENMEPEEERGQLFASLDDMAEMIEDILVLARTGRAREPLQRVDLTALADTVAEEFRELGKPVVFKEGERQVLEVQPVLLRRALRNLVDNACQHAQHVWVSVAADAEGAVCIAVEDDGPGIPADQIEEVIKPFKRLDPARGRERGGAGLGLAIAAAVAQAHGGKLALEARPGGGLIAQIVLPAAGGGGA